MAVTYSLDAYREQLRHYAQTMAVGDNRAASAGLLAGHSPSRVAMFTDGNLYKRYEKLQSACEVLADGLDELNDYIKEYIKIVPLSAYDTNTTDGERFLIWLDEKKDLTDEQRDYVRCQRGRHAIEFVALKQRLAHIRFQELLSMNDRLLPELETNPRLAIHLNPIHVWSRFETGALLDDADGGGATVMFFPVGEDIRTAVIEGDCESLIHLLEQQGVMRLKDLRKLYPHDSQSELPGLIRDLAEMGMVALG
ncbi:MAG: hypothetical protein JNG89_02055 [Planctomycetaceae bacterium]|nr:hypothetical protein [Planctomycetaceae bacterium]